jgi:hypothetical protein
MNLEIENLINMALADGEVTEKERGIILRKAEALGEDKDEVEMILDGKIALQKKELDQSQLSKGNISNKEGDIKKCPSCGAPVPSFTTKCADCGFEFRNIEVSNSVQSIFELLQRAATQALDEYERNPPKWFEQSLAKEFAIAKRIGEKQASIISTYPIPNSKEDILEFLSLASAQAKAKLPFALYKSTSAPHILKNAWISKCSQVISKAKFSMKDDKKTLEEIMQYAKELGIK